MTQPSTGSLTPTRRQLVKGMAWATPVIALAAAAPEVAASVPVACPAMPSGAAWTILNGASSDLPDNPPGQTCDSGPTTWTTQTTAGGSRTGIRMYSDSQTGCDAAQVREKEVDATASLTGLTVGCRYTISFQIWVAPGYGVGTCARHPSALTINLSGTALASYYTTTPTATEFPPAFVPPAGATPIPVTTSCSNETPPPSTFSDFTTFTTTFIATATSVPLNLHFRMAATNDSNNDDWLVIPTYTLCQC